MKKFLFVFLFSFLGILQLSKATCIDYEVIFDCNQVPPQAILLISSEGFYDVSIGGADPLMNTMKIQLQIGF